MSPHVPQTPNLAVVGATACRRPVARWSAIWIVLACVSTARATDGTVLAGDYICRSDCHPSDAPPSIEVNGTVANCRSDLGGVFYGRVLSDTSVSCFNMVGTLSANGRTIVWSNGGVWERHR